MEMFSKVEKIAALPIEPTNPNSDTESVAQDRAYYRPTGCHAAASTMRCVNVGGGLEAETGERSELLQGEEFDSREGPTDDRFEVRSSTPFPTREQDDHREMHGTEATGPHSEPPSSSSSSDHHHHHAYFDLRRDPDPRAQPDAPERSGASPPPRRDEPGSPWRSRRRGAELVVKGGYSYVVTLAGPSPPPGPPSAARVEAQQGPYHLHPQRRPATEAGGGSGTPGPLLLPPEASQTPGKGDAACRGGGGGHGETGTHLEAPARPPRQNAPDKREVAAAAGKPSKNTSKLKSPPPASRHLERARGDIVERNKITLGRNTTKCGSYLKAHAPKQGADDMTNCWKASEEEEEEEEEEGKEEVMLHGAGSTVEEGSDQDLGWLQKTQQLKAHRPSRGDRPQQKGNPGPRRPTRDPRPGAADRPGPRLCPPPGGGGGGGSGGGGGGGARPQAQKELSLNSTPLEVLPPISLSGDSAHSQTPSPSPSPSVGYADVRSPGDVRVPRWRLPRGTGGRGHVALGYPRPKRGSPPPQGFQNKLTSGGRVQRAPAPKWLLSYDHQHFLIHHPEEDDYEDDEDDEDDEDLLTRDGTRWTGGVRPRHSGSHLVLPPIGDDGRSGGGGSRPGTGAVSPRRRSSEPDSTSGYLAQMERQKQLKERLTYKVYTLKDYRQLRQVVNQCGLGPDKADEKTEEKMRRQRLYSNALRERNKKTSAIPLLPAKDPEDIHKMVPRMKALEYAKSIAKPHPKPQPKKHPDQSEGFPGLLGSAQLEGLDLAQLKALEDMRRRHEEEKRAVASFRKAPHVV